MSAVEQTTQDAPQTTGPVEITVIGQAASTPVVDTTKTDVTDVEVKEVKDAGKTAAEGIDDTGKAKPDEQPESKQGKPKTGFQDRVDELTRARRAAERDAAYWKARAQGDSAQNPAQPAEAKPPVRESYDSDEAFHDAMNDFKIDQKVSQKVQGILESQKADKEVTERATSWQSRLETAREAIPDFNEVVDNADIPVSPQVAQLMMANKSGPDLMYHFAKNPDALTEINSMELAEASMRIAEIALEIKKPATPAPAVIVEKSVSKAPPPARPIGQGRATSPTLAELPMDDYVKTRKSQGASWAR